jgi:hypothetical protein
MVTVAARTLAPVAAGVRLAVSGSELILAAGTAAGALTVAMATAPDPNIETSGATHLGDVVGDAQIDDFEGTGYSLDEIAEFVRGHADDGNPAMNRPSIDEIEATLKHGTTSPGGGNSVRYEYNGIRVIINRANPLRSTAYRLG